MAQWRAELASIKTSSTSLSEAISRMNQVIGQFQSLAAYLDTKQDQTTDATSPNATPAPAASPSDSASPGSTPASAPSATAQVSPSSSP
jgi:type VI protein secretion system component VasK